MPHSPSAPPSVRSVQTIGDSVVAAGARSTAIPVLAFKVKDPSRFTVFHISDQLRTGGWQVPDAAWEWRLKEGEAGRGLQTFDHGHHLWATAWFLLGEVERVVSWIDSADGIVDSPAVMMWKYKGCKVYGTCEYSFSSEMTIPSRYYANDEWIEITGSQGIIMIKRCTGNLLDGPAVSLFRKTRWEHFEQINSDWAQGFVGSTQNFIRAIRGEEEPLLTGHQAREILKMNLAIARSSETRREVCLGEQ